MDILEAIENQLKFILVGCETSKERDGMSEFWHVLIKYCQVKPIEPFDVRVRGLFIIAIDNDPFETVQKLQKVINNKSFEFQICKTFTPIDRLFKSSIEEMVSILPQYLKKIPSTAKWRISVNRRHTTLSRQKIIEIIANLPDVPKGKVDLENPEWEITVNIFEQWMAISVNSSEFIIKVEQQLQS